LTEGRFWYKPYRSQKKIAFSLEFQEGASLFLREICERSNEDCFLTRGDWQKMANGKEVVVIGVGWLLLVTPIKNSFCRGGKK